MVTERYKTELAPLASLPPAGQPTMENEYEKDVIGFLEPLFRISCAADPQRLRIGRQ